MIVQIYKETYYDYTLKNEIENTIFEDPIIIEFYTNEDFIEWRSMKEQGFAEKYNKKNGFEDDNKHVIHLHIAFRRLL